MVLALCNVPHAGQCAQCLFCRRFHSSLTYSPWEPVLLKRLPEPHMCKEISPVRLLRGRRGPGAVFEKKKEKKKQLGWGREVETGEDLKVSSEDWRAAQFQLLLTSCKYCTHSKERTGRHARERTNKHHLHLSGGRGERGINRITKERRSLLLVPPSGILQRGNFILFVAFCEDLWVFLLQAEHRGVKYYSLSGGIRVVTSWLHVTGINPQCKYCPPVSGVLDYY